MSWNKITPKQASYTPPSWSDGTDAEIVEALEKHYAGEIDLPEYWSVGDERIIHFDSYTNYNYSVISAQDVPFVITEVGGKYLSDGITECAFQIDIKPSSSVGFYCYWHNSASSCIYRNSYVRTTELPKIYAAISSSIKPIFKQFTYRKGNDELQDYLTLRAEKEIIGDTTYSGSACANDGNQVEYYKTSSNINRYSDAWTRNRYCNGASGNCVCWQRNGTMTVGNMQATGVYNLAIFGCI